mgnify:CR=1 FL=1
MTIVGSHEVNKKELTTKVITTTSTENNDKNASHILTTKGVTQGRLLLLPLY